MPMISVRWLLLVSCMVAVVVAAPRSSEESSEYRRYAQSSESDSDSQEDLTSSETKFNEEKLDDQTTSTKPTPQIGEVKREAQLLSDTEDKTKLASTTESGDVSTTKSPEREARAAQEEKTGQQTIPTKPTTETSEIKKPEEVKREAESSESESGEENSNIPPSTQSEALSTTKSPERNVRAAQELKTGDQKLTTEISKTQTPEDVKQPSNTFGATTTEVKKTPIVN
ncbi:hypothetical protein L9F63_003208 [Diploptera punctata]|uniref:Uncharacterized protein n=1 Tax=Diploptera punctata TaxID=6984 RepID=A0AAD7ZL76_DIPPU|nr:hypothetical protein L9F63_003208 [Diploptera punctata]